jgi:hypothetical protein
MVGLAKLVFQVTLDPGTGESEKGTFHEIQLLVRGDSVDVPSTDFLTVRDFPSNLRRVLPTVFLNQL